MEETRDPIYTAMGSFITAYAREITISAAQENYDIFAYADTDSLHLLSLSDPENLAIHPTELGKWKLEYRFSRALFVRAKTYIEEKVFQGIPFDYQTETHVAGMSVKIAKKLTLETFTSGESYSGNLKQKVVPGGVVLVDVDFKLPVW